MLQTAIHHKDAQVTRVMLERGSAGTLAIVFLLFVCLSPLFVGIPAFKSPGCLGTFARLAL